MKNVQLKQGMELNRRYIIEKTLGQGGFGITYLAADRQMKQFVVVKEYFPVNFVFRENAEEEIQLIRPEEDRKVYEKGQKRFLEEARVIASLQAVPEIVRVLNYFRENGTVYIVMEYVKGISLRMYMERLDELPDFTACKTLLFPVIKALEAVHEKGLIHRDITPDNLLIRDDGTIKIIDFGSAREYVQDDRTKTVLVKAGYAPLEQYSGKEKQKAWTDVYSLCAVFYEMLTGAALPDALKRAGGAEVYPPSLYGAEILPEEEAVLMKGIALDYKDRIRSMTALERELFPKEELISDEKKKKKLWIIPAVVLLAGTVFLSSGFHIKKEAEYSDVFYAGNYGRSSKIYNEFIDFVKESALSEEKTEEGVLYTLGWEAVIEWGEPCNRRRFFRSIGRFQKYLTEQGYTGEWTDGAEKYTAEIGRYGGIQTYFGKELLYADDNGNSIRIFYDPVNEDILTAEVFRKNESVDVTETAVTVFNFLTEYPVEDIGKLKEEWKEMEKEKRAKKEKVLVGSSLGNIYTSILASESRDDIIYLFTPFSPWNAASESENYWP